MHTRAITLGTLLAFGTAAFAQPQADFAQRWVRPTDTLTLRVPQELAGADLRVIAGATDVSALIRFPQPGVLALDLRVAPLPPGESELILYRADAPQWEEVARFPLKVLTATGFEKSRFEPKLDLASKSQFGARATGTAALPARTPYNDLTGRGGASFELARGAFGFDGSFNAAGSSFRDEALRFGELAARAPKTDLADYVVNTRWHDTRLTVGHLSWGNHPLLLNGYGSRGLSLMQRFGTRADVSLAAINGTAIVGYDNLLGLDAADHRIYGAGFGFELLGSRPGALRAELTLLDAALESRNNFNVGEVTDAEQSRGIGLRLSGSTAGNRVRVDLALARSRYVNPFDPLLAQGGALQPVQPVTSRARSADLSFDLLQASQALSAHHPLTVTLALHHERLAPLYRSLGATLNADQQLNRAALTAQIGGAQVRLSAARREDNLDNVATILKNRTDTSGFGLTLPPWGADAAGRSWWPQVSYNGQLTHQRALNAPLTAASGIAETHRPDQKNADHQLSLAWTRDPWSFSYALSYATQDNRQIGRENADFANLGHQLTLTLRAFDALNLNLGVSRARNDSTEKNVAAYTTGGTAGVDWQLGARWSLAANVGRTLNNDSQDVSQSANSTAQAQLSYRYELPSFGRKLPGQVFIRCARQGSATRDSVFGLNTRGSNTAWDAGLSMSLF
jgi:hypothetical protein